MLSKAEIQEWQANKITKDFVDRLQKDMEVIYLSWSSGQYTAETAEGTAQLNASALGQFRALEDVVTALEEFHTEGETL